MVIDVVSAAGYMSLFNYLYYIFTQPLILISRRKKGKFGVIYNSLSKLHVDLAAVRIKNAAGKIVQTKITDKQGRYYFLLPKGQYEVDISKQGYSFPSGLLAGKTQDVDYIDLLTNNKLNFTADAFVANNIPIDPKEDARKHKDIKRKLTLRKVQSTAAVLTTLLSFGVFALVPTYQYLGLAVFQLLTYVVFRRLAYRKPFPSYGVILDQKTGKPIKSAVVRILDTQFNRILETQITDAQGRYAFLVGRGKFYVTINKDGYESVRSEAIDCSGSKDSVVIDKKIKLQPIK
ncbi:MAG: carboxypeptidase-like regulatory domain-containing protein [Patescibacteria group bacterium]